jgi:hypothetical protein
LHAHTHNHTHTHTHLHTHLHTQDEDFLYEALDVEGMEAALTALGGPFDLEQLLGDAGT